MRLNRDKPFNIIIILRFIFERFYAIQKLRKKIIKEKEKAQNVLFHLSNKYLEYIVVYLKRTKLE